MKTTKKFLMGILLSAGTYQSAHAAVLLELLSPLEDAALEACLQETISTGSLSTVGDLTSLSCENSAITTTGGIEQLTALTDLDLSGNELSAVDLSSNTALEQVDFSNNQLTSINVDDNANLTLLNVTGNPLDAATQAYLSGLADINVFFDLTLTLDSAGTSFTNWLDSSVVPSNSVDVINISVSDTGFYNLVVSGVTESGFANASLLLLESDSESFLDYAEVSNESDGLLRARLEAGSHYQLTAFLLNGGSLEYTLEAAQPSSRTLSGRITDRDGRARRGIAVSLMAGEKLIGQSTTNRNGRYSITAYGAPFVEVAVSDPSGRHATYYFSKSLETLSSLAYDEESKGYFDATAIPFLENDWNNINLRVSGAGVEGGINPGAFTADSDDYVILEFLTNSHSATGFTQLAPDNGAFNEFHRLPLAPNTRYLVRARLSSDGVWTKAWPPFIHTGRDGTVSRTEFTMEDPLASEFSGTAAPAASVYEGYDLSLIAQVLDNDTDFDRASHIPPDIDLKGSLGGEDGVDVYALEIESSGAYEIGQDSGAVLTLYDHDGETIPCPDISSCQLNEGLYYLEVAEGAGEYRLHVEPVVETILVDDEEPHAGDRGRHVDAGVDPIDVYTFAPDQSGVYDFGFDFNDDDGFLVMRLKDSGGNLLAAGHGSRRFLSRQLDANTTYMLEIEAAFGAARYRLGVEAKPVSLPPARFLRHPFIPLPR